MLLYAFDREYVVPESQVQGHGGKPRNVFVNRDLGKNPSYITCFCEQFWENLISFSTGGKPSYLTDLSTGFGEKPHSLGKYSI